MKSRAKILSNILTGLAILFIVFELQYAFKQYLYAPLDGDFVSICLPGDNYTQVLKDPFGFELLQTKASYSATNRFFSHFAMNLWFGTGQKVTESLSADPINGLFLSSAFFSWLMHLSIAVMLLRYIRKIQELSRRKSILAFAAILSFFHYGSSIYAQIGIIDHAVTYSFFYALPVLVLSLFYWPFYTRIFTSKSFTVIEHLGLISGVIIIPFFGGFMAPLILFCNGFILLALFFQGWKSSFSSNSKTVIIYLILISIWAIYSFYIGSFNNENSSEVGLLERYPILIKGLYEYFTHSLVYVWIFGLLGMNYFLLKKFIPSISTYYLIFIAIIALYIFSLPLGGYRSYRPWIVRYDVMLPVTLILIWAIISSSVYLLKKYQNKAPFRNLSLIYFAAFILIGVSDYHRYNKKDFQRKKLRAIQNAENNSIIYFRSDEPLLIWFAHNYNDYQHQNVMNYLKKWKMIPPDKNVTIVYQ